MALQYLGLVHSHTIKQFMSSFRQFRRVSLRIVMGILPLSTHHFRRFCLHFWDDLLLHIASSVVSIMASRIVSGKRSSVSRDGIVDLILIHCDSIQHCKYYLKRTKGLWQ